jgi:hypothetical protein
MGPDGMSKKQHKQLDAARRVAEPGSEILAYGTGTGHARMSRGLIGLVVGFVALFVVVLLAVHVVLIPGVVLVVVAIGLIRPRRGVAVTPDGVLVFHESMWNAKPNRLIFSGPAASFHTPTSSTGSRVSVLLGPERVTLKTTHYERLLHAVAPPALELPPT